MSMEPTDSFTIYLKPSKGNFPPGVYATKGANVEHHLKVQCCKCKQYFDWYIKAADQKAIPGLGIANSEKKCTDKCCRLDKKSKEQFSMIEGNQVAVSYLPKRFVGADTLKIKLFGVTISKYCADFTWELCASGIAISLGEVFRMVGEDKNEVNMTLCPEILPC